MFASRFVAKVSTTFFASNSLCFNTVLHPARMDSSVTPATALQNFRLTFKRAGLQQISMLALGIVSGAVAYHQEPDNLFLASTVVYSLILPFTLLVIGPINRQLHDPALDKDSNKVKDLINQWNSCNAVRTFLSSVAAFIWLYYA